MFPFAPILFSAVLLADGSEQGSPLKTITTVTSRPVCTTLRTVVGPAVYGLRVNDGQLRQSVQLFRMAARDIHNGSGKIDLEIMRLGSEENAIAQNIAKIEGILADASLGRNASVSDRALKGIKEKLQRVLALQKAQRNVISGTVESETAAKMSDPADFQLAVAAASDGSAQARFASPHTHGDTTGENGAFDYLSKTPDTSVSDIIRYAQRLEQQPALGATSAIISLLSDCR